MEINPVSGARLLFQTSIDGGSNYNVTLTCSAFRAIHAEADNDSGVSYRTAGDQGQGTSYQWLTETIKNDADACGVGELYLFDPSSTTYVKHFYSRTAEYFGSPRALDNHVGGYINVTAAITQIDFKFGSGNIDSGTIKLYGI